jgi:hypothetical protein
VALALEVHVVGDCLRRQAHEPASALPTGASLLLIAHLLHEAPGTPLCASPVAPMVTCVFLARPKA